MQKVLFLGLIVVCYCSASGQTSARRAVLWSGEVSCGYRTKGIAPDESLTCGSIETPRGHVSTISHDGVNLAVAFLTDDDHLIVATHIKNMTGEPFGFDTDLWGAAHFRTRDEYYKAQKPLLAETSIPSRDIARGIKSGVVMDNSIDTFMAGVAKTMDVRMVRRSDGTLVRKETIIDDPDAKREAGSRNEIRSEYATDAQEKIRKTAMTQKWLPASGSAKGLVYFRRVKDADFVVFSFKLLDTTYIFRLPKPKK